MGFLERIKAAGRTLVYGPNGQAKPTSVIDRASIAAHLSNWYVSDHRNELEHNRGWSYVGIHAVAKQFMQAEVCVYDDSRQPVKKTFASGGTEEQRTPVKNHPFAKLLKRPNPLKSGAQFRYQVGQQLRLTGGCVIWDVRDQNDRPKEMWVMPRGWLQPQPPTEQYPVGYFRVTPVTSSWGGYRTNPFGGGFFLDRRCCIEIGYPHSLYPGEFASPLDACSQIIDIAEKLDEATFAALVNAIVPGLIFSVDPGVQMTEDQQKQFLADVVAYKSGTSNARKAMVAQGVTPSQMSPGPNELDYVNGRDQSRRAVLATQHTPPIAIGEDNDGTYSGAAAKLKQWTVLSIKPDLDMFAESLTHRYQPVYGDDFEVQVLAANYDDPTLKLQRAQALSQGMSPQARDCVTVNEWRASMDLPPVPGGDKLQKPQAMPMDQLAGSSAPPDMGVSAPMSGGDDSEFDLSPDLSNDDGPGDGNPMMRRTTGNFNGMPSRNGVH